MAKKGAVLLDSYINGVHVKVGSVVELSNQDAKVYGENGVVDLHPDAVAAREAAGEQVIKPDANVADDAGAAA